MFMLGAGMLHLVIIVVVEKINLVSHKYETTSVPNYTNYDK